MVMDVRVVLVDDHPLFRSGLREMLAREPDVSVVAEAGDARQAYQAAETGRPDVIVVDVKLPGVDGIAATRELTRRAPSSRVLVLSMYEEAKVAAQALDAGAAGFATKGEPPEAIMAAIRAVGRGEIYLPPTLSRSEVAAMRGRDGGPLGILSPREREVFELVTRGFSNQDVARELCVSIKTVETHRAHIHRKLGVHSVAELIRYAALNGLIQH
jgi:DNA-binding NarL/FixJ family response regulator